MHQGFCVNEQLAVNIDILVTNLGHY